MNECVTRSISTCSILLVLAACAIGCAGSGSSAESSDAAAPPQVASSPNPSGLEKLEIATAGALYMKPGRPIGAYDSFKLNRVDVSFKGNHHYSEQDEERVRDHVRSTLLRDMEATGLPIVDLPDDCTLVVDVGVLDIELADPISETGSATHFRRSWGKATIIQRLYDGETRALLMQFSVRREIPGGLVSALVDGRDWGRIQQTLDKLIRDTQAALLAALPVVETPQMKPGCRGGIYALRQRTG